MKHIQKIIVVTLLFASVAWGQSSSRPNFIIIFADDQGYGDLGCYGSPNIETPNIDRLAAEGIRFTSFYAAPFCGPARASLMTGSYPPRASLAFNHGPKAETGINPDEVTIAEILKSRGYTTMHIGKWHLGDHPKFLPTKHGFDKYFGLPYSNDMWPYHPKMPITENEHPRMTAARKRAAYTGFGGQGSYRPKGNSFENPLPLMSGEEIIETNPDQTQLTTRYTEKALEFVTENKDKPFFLYFAHAMPHVPLFVSDKFKGKSQRGLYGDVIMEIDWSVGQIVNKLKQLGIDENTMIVYTSDNGPWLAYGIDGGSAGPLRSGKGTYFEGGMRVPAIMRWPNKIPAGKRTNEIAALMDLLPTFAAIAGAELPTDRVLDGRNLWPVISGQANAKSPHQAFYYFGGSMHHKKPGLRAVRDQRWKLLVKKQAGKFVGVELYDLHNDISEKENRIEDHPNVAKRLELMAQTFYDELLHNIRPIGQLAEN